MHFFPRQCFAHAETAFYCPINAIYALGLFRSLAACLKLKLHSSYARPAPNPAPMKAGHALRLNRRTEKTTPNPRPRVDFTRRLERQRSHCEELNVSVSCIFQSDKLRRWYYLLVKQGLAHGPRNGARGRVVRGLGHCDVGTANTRVRWESFCAVEKSFREAYVAQLMSRSQTLEL